ncbi:MAG: MFS transporter [Firmicutes bacterium]|mgnify:CR=1 FL=1|nr:MFS transporter [Bacillota bacterium]
MLSDDPKPKQSRLIYLIFALLISAHFFSYFFRVSASVVFPDLAIKLGMSPTLTGLISSLYFYSYGIMQPVSGALNDRFGPIKVVSSGLLISGVGAILHAFANSPWRLATGRILFGLGLAPVLSGALVYQADHFSPSRYTFFAGITHATGNLGAIISVAPLGIALDKWGQKTVFLALVALTAILSSSLYLSKDYNKQYSHTKGDKEFPAATKEILSRLGQALLGIAKSSQLYSLGIVAAVSFGALMSLQGLWAVAWAQSVYGSSSSSARIWATMIGIGVMAGNWVGTQITGSAVHRRFALTVTSLTNCVFWVILWIGMSVRWPMTVTGVAGFILGMSAGAFFTQTTAGINDVAKKGHGGALFGAMNLFPSVGVILFQLLTGGILSRFHGSAINTYTAASFRVTFGVTGMLVLISQLALFRLGSFSPHMKPDTLLHKSGMEISHK